MFFHFTPPHPNFLTPLFNSAFVFVGFFFLISGFVLAYNYADRPTLPRRAFYVARIARVYPTYLLVLLLSIPFLALEWHARNHYQFFRGLALTPLALQGWSPAIATFWNTVGWTVPAEFTLYAVFPFLLIFIARHADRIRTPGRLVAAILCLWVVGILPHTAYYLFNPDHLAAPANRFTYAFWLRGLKFSPPPYFCTFTAGILLCRLHALLPLTVFRRTLLALIGFAGVTLFLIFAVDRVPYILVHGSLLLPLFSILIIGLAGPNPIAGILAWRPIVLLGETTFALYLLHFNAFTLIHFWRLPERLHVVRLDPWISYAFIMLLAFLISRFYEKPARRFLLSLISPKT